MGICRKGILKNEDGLMRLIRNYRKNVALSKNTHPRRAPFIGISSLFQNKIAPVNVLFWAQLPDGFNFRKLRPVLVSILDLIFLDPQPAILYSDDLKYLHFV
jgi:hypothetical protein